jgi:hypothetical protein
MAIPFDVYQVFDLDFAVESIYLLLVSIACSLTSWTVYFTVCNSDYIAITRTGLLLHGETASTCSSDTA